MSTIGIDLGTSSVKLLLMGDDGSVLKTTGRAYPVIYPHPGWSEQSPADWLRETVSALRDLLAGQDTGTIRGIGIGGQMHGLVLLDKDDEVIRPAILWNDGRTEEETVYLNETIGRKRLSEYTANIAFAGFTAPKLLWMQKHEPDNFARIHKIMLPKDYLVYMLTGVHATDVSDASGTLLFNVKNRCWSDEMCDICNVKKDWLPKLYESYEAVGKLKTEYEEMLGLSDVTVVAGAGDNAAAAVGTGTVGNGMCNISLGTSGTVFISGRDFLSDQNNSLHAFAHADGAWHLMGCMLSAASCCGWWMEKVQLSDDFDSMTAGAEKVSAEERVFFLPYLMGERSPHNDVNARGAFIGLTPETDRYAMFRAILEGVSFGLRDSVEVANSIGIHIQSSFLCGGGAKNEVWGKILSNVLGITLQIPEVEEGPSMGAAMLAAVACGVYPSVQEAASRIVKISHSIVPEPELTKIYEEKYHLFRQFYPVLKDSFARLA